MLYWGIHSNCKSGGNGVEDPAVSISGRLSCEKTPCSYDEYYEWRKTLADNTVDLQEFMIMPCGARKL